MANYMARKPRALSWVPKRLGAVYCAPACGHGCKHSDYLTAQRRAARLCAKLGKGWRPNVWENLGWHYSAKFAGVHELELYPHFAPKPLGSCWLSFIPEDGASQITAEGQTPDVAVYALRTKVVALWRAAARALKLTDGVPLPGRAPV